MQIMGAVSKYTYYIVIVIPRTSRKMLGPTKNQKLKASDTSSVRTHHKLWTDQHQRVPMLPWP